MVARALDTDVTVGLVLYVDVTIGVPGGYFF
jgi:hypothetical protein